MAPPAQAEDSGAWVVKKTTGDVVYRGGDAGWAKISIGQRLLPGTKLKSGSSGRANIEPYGDSITLSPSSAVELPAAKGGVGISGVVQTLGTLLYKIAKRKDNKFSVRTPYLSAVIKGTTFTVTVGSAGSALHVTEGAVQVSSRFTGETALIRPGQTGEVSGTGRRGLRVLQGRRSLLRRSPSRGSTKIRRSLGRKRINIREVTKGLAQGHGSKSNGEGRSGTSGVGKNKHSAEADVAAGMASGPVSAGTVSAGSSSASSTGSANASPQGVAVGLTGATPPGLVNNANSNAGGNGKGKGKGKGKNK